jgi:putative ABC transport system substrate-binding protein
MRRREFIGLIGGAGLVWPFAAHAQPSGPVRRIGVLMNRAANDPEGQARLAALQQGLEQAGWSIGRNVQIDLRWGEDDLDLEAKHAAELVALAPDLIFASGTLSVAAVKRLSRTIPIVFVGVTDPLGAGFVDSLARPGGNATGFMIYEYSLSGKWLELLKEIAPSMTRVVIIRNPDNPPGSLCLGRFRPKRDRLESR